MRVTASRSPRLCRVVSIPKSNALLDVLPTAYTYLVIFLLFLFMLAQTGPAAAALFAAGKATRAASRAP